MVEGFNDNIMTEVNKHLRVNAGFFPAQKDRDKLFNHFVVKFIGTTIKSRPDINQDRTALRLGRRLLFHVADLFTNYLPQGIAQYLSGSYGRSMGVTDA